MVNFIDEQKKESKAKRFFKKCLKLVTNNFVYKLIAVVCSVALWLSLTYIFK